jgi:hypothetical protein
MRKIDWEKPLSEEDVRFLVQAGIPGMEDRIRSNQARFGAEEYAPEVPEDTLTKSALDPTARTGEPIVPVDAGAPEDEPVEDDYDTWSKADLETEVTARNDLADTSDVEVTGTGKDGAVLKADLVKGLRLWDQENPTALS